MPELYGWCAQRVSWQICICLNFLSARTPDWRVWRTLLSDMRLKAFAGAPSYYRSPRVIVFFMRKSCVSSQTQHACIGSKFSLSSLRQYAELGIWIMSTHTNGFKCKYASQGTCSVGTPWCAYQPLVFVLLLCAACCAVCLWSTSSLFCCHCE